MIKSLKYVVILSGFMFACGDVELNETITLAEKRLEDIESIEAYIMENNLGVPDTTPSGGRYIILDEGDGDSMEFGDIVGFDYIGYTLTGRVFDTSLPEVADTAFSRTFDFLLKPQFFNFTPSGWTLQSELQVTNQFMDGNVEGTALSEAITTSFQKMKLGGKLVVFLPSDQAFEGEQSIFFPAFSVIVYDIFPVQKL